jgi:hypothetical protein
MLNDAFKLTLDVIYPPIKSFTGTKQVDDPITAINEPTQEIASPLQEKFSVDGYSDEVNMWGESFYQFRSPI